MIPEIVDYRLSNMHRQALINGNFDVWQRGTAFYQPLNATYAVDRWKINHNIEGNVKITQSTDVPPNGLSKYSMRIEQYYAAGPSSDVYTNNIQWIENYEFFRGKTVTVSFWAKCDDNTSSNLFYLDYTGSIGCGNYFKGDGTWKYYSYTVDIPSNITSLGVNLRYSRMNQPIGKGMNFAQVQMCLGKTALPFQPKSFVQELQDCMRYFEKSINYAQTATVNITPDNYVIVPANNITTGWKYGFVNFKVKKRVVPNVALYTWHGVANKVSHGDGQDITDASIVNMIRTESGFGLVNQSGTTMNPIQGVIIFNYEADAEM